MKTLNETLSAIDNEGWDRGANQMLDSRDISRLLAFVPHTEWKKYGFCLKEGATPDPVLEWNESNIMKKFESDLEFAFEKAYDQRGISTNLMYEVIGMWLWILGDEEWENENYHDYGLRRYRYCRDKYFPQMEIA